MEIVGDEMPRDHIWSLKEHRINGLRMALAAEQRWSVNCEGASMKWEEEHKHESSCAPWQHSKPLQHRSGLHNSAPSSFLLRAALLHENDCSTLILLLNPSTAPAGSPIATSFPPMAGIKPKIDGNASEAFWKLHRKRLRIKGTFPTCFQAVSVPNPFRNGLEAKIATTSGKVKSPLVVAMWYKVMKSGTRYAGNCH
ncbi:hypothetical protein R6Q59_019583 [Mikania micrantha]